MRSPKILQLPRRTAALFRTARASATGSAHVLALLAAGLLAQSACSGVRAPDSPDRVEKRAVAMANDRCEQEYGKRPFRTGRFPATLSGERWLWGWLDAAGGQGFTAQVSFRADGSEPETRIYSIAKEEFDMETPDAPRLGSSPETEPLTR